MNNEKTLIQAFELLIPIANYILFDQETKPLKEEKGYKLVDDFKNSFAEQQKASNSIDMHITSIVGGFLQTYNMDQKSDVVRLFIDNESLAGVTYLFTNQSSNLDFNDFIKEVITKFIDNSLSKEMAVFLNFHFLFLYEMDFTNGYVSEQQYDQIMKRITQKATV